MIFNEQQKTSIKKCQKLTIKFKFVLLFSVEGDEGTSNDFFVQLFDEVYKKQSN